MTSDHTIFDRPLLRRRRQRAAADAARHDFLLQRVADDFAERLSIVRREFPVAANIGAHHGVLTERLLALPSIGNMIETDTVDYPTPWIVPINIEFAAARPPSPLRGGVGGGGNAARPVSEVNHENAPQVQTSKDSSRQDRHPTPDPSPEGRGVLSEQTVASNREGMGEEGGPTWRQIGASGKSRTRIVADEEALPFAAESLDLAVSGLALHHVNDLPGALIQIRRALKPDGLFLGAVLGGETLKELREAWLIAEDEVSGGASPRVAPFADVRDLGGLLQRAGFALPVADTDVVRVTYASPLDLMREIKAMGASNVLTARRRVPVTRKLLFRAAEVYAERFALPDGRVSATFEIITLTAWVPHESQQKPLQPGSAKARLADALGVKEQGAGEKVLPDRSEE